MYSGLSALFLRLHLKFYLQDPQAVYRSDFFGGLGWMITRKIWEELYPKWPVTTWDEWMRWPAQRRGRACLRPEV